MENLKKHDEFPFVLALRSSQFRHTICVDLNDWSKPYPEQLKDRWDENHVRMPCSPQSEFVKLQDDGSGDVVPRWPIVTVALTRELNSAQDIELAILEYNLVDRWDFRGLYDFFTEVFDPEGPESAQFFDFVLPGMCQLALELPRVLTSPLPLLKKKKTQSITMSQLQLSSLLANAFFCTFPKRNSQSKKASEYSTYPTINFNSLFVQPTENNPKFSNNKFEKLKCIFTYFRRRLEGDCGQSVVTFLRRCIPFRNLPDWPKSQKKLRKLRVSTDGTIEDDGEGMLQVRTRFVVIGILRLWRNSHYH